jgi:hypothetical protein
LRWEWVNGYGVRFVQVEKLDDLYQFDVGNCYVRVRERGLMNEVRRLGVVGVEYMPEVVRRYDVGSKIQALDRVVIDIWQLLEDYGRKVLKVRDREIQWLRDRM